MACSSTNSSHTNCSIDLFLQFGLDRINLSFDGKDMQQLRQVASELIARKYPRHFNPSLPDNLLLFKHNYHTSQIIDHITTLDALEAGDTIEIVIKVDYMNKVFCEDQARLHNLHVHSYKKPTFCDFCSVMLFGLHHQGLKCIGCGGNFHKRCVLKIPNNCKGVKGRNDMTEPLTPSLHAMSRESERRMSQMQWDMGHDSAITSDSSTAGGRRATWSIESSGNSNGYSPYVNPVFAQIEIPHTFFIHSYKVPTVCQVCKKLLKGLFRQGLRCKDCKFNCHEKCEDKATRSCGGEDSLTERDEELRALAEEMDDLHVTATSDSTVETMSTKTSNIQLQRLVTVQSKTSNNFKVMKTGWMVYFTKSENVLETHYWHLHTKKLCMFDSDHELKELRSISLQDVLSVDMKDPLVGQTHSYIFTLKTIDDVYYCGQQDEADQNGAKPPFEKSNGRGTEYGNDWAIRIKAAYQPISPQSSIPNAIPTKELELKKDISEVYQIFSDDVLGSGQFGTVYSGVHRQTGTHVAVKCIDKLKFGQIDRETNEVEILQKIDHPAVLNVQQMFETPDNIFVIMEKLSSDMLKYILESPMGRLTEHQTKVITYQILIALQFLHSRDIVHCDLKPENVLLSGYFSQSGVPQIKLCDFGFARIIGQESFRRTMVGTPAYVAPEVLSNRKYNRYLDMWSTGVVVYVTLTGTFPYNQEEDIEDQIKNAQFMYPSDPWDSISKDAQNFIDKLLQVKSNSRLATSGALLHAWMQDYHAYLDLRSLDKVVGRRYLTNENDDLNWEQKQNTVLDV